MKRLVLYSLKVAFNFDIADMFYTAHLLIVGRFLKNCLNQGPVYSKYFVTANTKFRLKNNLPIEKYLRIVDTR